MPSQRTLPGLGLGGYAPRGDSNWDLWMDPNMLTVSAVSQLAVEDVSALPATPSDGMIYIVSGGVNDQKVAVRDNGVWVYLVPKLGWRATVKAQKNRQMYFDGAQWTVPNGDFTETFVDHGTIVTGTVTLDLRAGSAKKLIIGGACTVAFSNWSPAGTMTNLFLELVNGGSASIIWPTIQWIKADGTFQTTPVRTPRASGTDWMVFWSRDGGATVYGKYT